VDKDALLNFFLEPRDIDEETALIYLTGRGMNPAESEKEFLDFIIDKQVKIKIKKGEKPQKFFNHEIENGIT
jgi:hypothetical protein